MKSFHAAISLLLAQSLASAQFNGTSQDATAFALEYGYPLIQFERYARPMYVGGSLNAPRHARQLATAASQSVVSPNDDTLYSSILVDVSQNDMFISTPTLPAGQFALFSYYGIFGDNLFNGSTGHEDLGRAWQIRWTPDNTSTPGLVREGQAYINSPSAYGVFLMRWLVNATNLDLVHSSQDKVVVANSTTKAVAPAQPFAELPGEDKSQSSALNVLSLLAAYAPASRPENVTDIARVRSTLQAAGVTNGTWQLPSSVNLGQANTTALGAIAKSAVAAQGPLNNGWSSLKTNKTGNFGTDYALRAAAAAPGYLMLTAPDAVYPSWTNSSAGQSAGSAAPISVGANESLLYTFSGKPPLTDTGFWSLTVYASDRFFLPNNRNVYSVGDRSNLTHANGKPVYGNGAGPDGQFQVLIQEADTAPPANWTGNSIPSPAGGGDVHVLLRWYGAKEPLLNGVYQYPVVSRQAVLTGGGDNSTAGQNGSTSATPAGSSFGVKTEVGCSTALALAAGMLFAGLIL